MQKTSKFICSVCHQEYSSVNEALACESKGLAIPYYKIGDVLTYQICMGGDRGGVYLSNCTGKILDILFPIPISTSPHLGHWYAVSYLIQRLRGENYRSKLFEGEQIELLQISETVQAVSEESVYFEDGQLGLWPMNAREDLDQRRTVVSSWSDYVASILTNNPQLTGRLSRFTLMLRELGAIE